jgi:tRNA A37 threonylcarbamoyladenosine modification protein TsaB
VIDARRSEVFIHGPDVASPDDLELAAGTVCVGSGAVRYRTTLERKGAIVPADDDERHVPRARHHAALAREFGSAEDVLPVYVRPPDVEHR